MRVLSARDIREAISPEEAIEAMRPAVIAQSRRDCEVPMPMHLAGPGGEAEVHVKSAWCRGGPHFALKAAGTFPGRARAGGSASAGMMLLFSAETGDPVAYLADDGYLTDLRTAAVAALVARELARDDRVLGILGTGVQARLQAELHSRVLPLEEVVVWGRSAERRERCAADVHAALPGCDVRALSSAAEVAAAATLLVSATASRAPLLFASDLRPRTHVSAVGSDSPGKQELDPAILAECSLLLVDSLAQCERLGELQHAPGERERAIEIGAFLDSPQDWDRAGISVCDFTGLGVEDLYIAELAYRKVA